LLIFVPFELRMIAGAACLRCRAKWRPKIDAFAGGAAYALMAARSGPVPMMCITRVRL
jgi:hypothetical protein